MNFWPFKTKPTLRWVRVKLSTEHTRAIAKKLDAQATSLRHQPNTDKIELWALLDQCAPRAQAIADWPNGAKVSAHLDTEDALNYAVVYTERSA